MSIEYISHPIYTDFESSRCVIIRHRRFKKYLGRINKFGYMCVVVYNCGKMKNYQSARFIYECYNGFIPIGLIIDHINRDKLDNRLDNLRVVTPSEKYLDSTPGVKLQYR